MKERSILLSLECHISAVISFANAILVHVGLPRRVDTLRQCNSSLFSQLYETLTGCRVPGLALQAPTSEAVKCQAVVDALNVHLSPHVRLDHIYGSDVAQFDTISIKNLLDIFSVLFHVPPTSAFAAEDGGAYSSYSDDSDGEFRETLEENEANDSNIISTEGLSVISEVLREELDRSSHSTVTDSTTELLRPVPVARLPPSIVNTAAKHKNAHVPPQIPHKSRGGSAATSSNESSVATNSQHPSLTISSLQSTSTEGSTYEQRMISHVREMAARGSASQRDDGSTTMGGKTATLFIPSGDSSIGTTPSPKLHTPPQSPRQHHTLSPLHHSTPHTSTRSRLFPSSTSTTISSTLTHPLGTASVTPSVTVARQHRAAVIATRSLPTQEQSSLLASEESTLVPQSSPSPSGRSRLVEDLTITDLHTTTMSSGGGGTDRPAGADNAGLSEESYSTSSETPPPTESRLPRTTHAVCTCTPPSSRAATAAQKVRFSQSTEQRERARHESGLSSGLSEQSGVEVGNLSSIQCKLGLDAQAAQSRANVLATLYQNYLSELKTSRPAAASSEKKVRTTSKTGATSKTKVKSHSRSMSKVQLYFIHVLAATCTCYY